MTIAASVVKTRSTMRFLRLDHARDGVDADVAPGVGGVGAAEEAEHEHRVADDAVGPRRHVEERDVALRQVALDELPRRQPDDGEHAQRRCRRPRATASARDSAASARTGAGQVDGHVMVRLDLLAGWRCEPRRWRRACASPLGASSDTVPSLLLAGAVVGDELLDLHAELVRVDARLELGADGDRLGRELLRPSPAATRPPAGPAFFIDVSAFSFSARSVLSSLTSKSCESAISVFCSVRRRACRIPSW